MRFALGPSVIKKPIEPGLPSLTRQVTNVARASGRVIKAAVAGELVWLTPARAREHRAICETNRCGFFRRSDSRCAHPECGCFIRLKARIATEDCPAGLFRGRNA